MTQNYRSAANGLAGSGSSSGDAANGAGLDASGPRLLLIDLSGYRRRSPRGRNGLEAKLEIVDVPVGDTVTYELTCTFNPGAGDAGKVDQYGVRHGGQPGRLRNEQHDRLGGDGDRGHLR